MKKMKNLLKTVFAFAIAGLFFASCAKAPEVELASAKTAVETVKASEAERYVPAEFKALQDSLNVAMLEIETQNAKFSLFRNYKKATASLLAVTSMSETVKQNAETRKEEVKNQAQQALAEATALVTEVKDLLASAPKGKEGKEALEAIQGDVVLVESFLAEVSTLINSGDYLTAVDKVKAASEKAAALKTELEEAIAKTQKRR
jgi:hypothetical protein